MKFSTKKGIDFQKPFSRIYYSGLVDICVANLVEIVIL